ncbi:DEAD/DEAH box helicase [Flagellimonas iocasae]|uniref:DEAD/DEAH box helicase n=1 Tax=Flagellimonas iocasae TaxID=2055905 RepID=A0ABW4XU63_9FLAO
MAYSLLSEPIRKYIRDKRWENLRPIQAAAIDRILSTDNNYILASHTASGKTEAAFLPILSKINYGDHGVQVLYISPLIALINDQFQRVEDLCKNLDIEVTKWHGEASRSKKKKLLNNPNGIVLITPESIEAMFVNSPFNIKHLFSNLKYIVIDEIHSFLGTDRGLQLMSLINRIQQESKSRIIIIGLSATIGKENFLEVKKITGNESHTKVLVDSSIKETEAHFKYFESKAKEYSFELLKELYKETQDEKVLLFPNSRAKTEEVSVKLGKISKKLQGHSNYFSHHSSVDKEIRESIEYFAKTNNRLNFCISCTSTLELGIDIGTVDKIIQIDSTHSVASLVQRIGRSGRKDGTKSRISIYATNEWSLLQSLACWLLYKNGFLEPLKISVKPFDILLHQLLSIIKQTSGLTKNDLKLRLKNNPAFIQIEERDIFAILEHGIKKDYLEEIQGELILGIEGEKIVNSREFYSVFKTESEFRIINAGRKIGQIPFSPQIKVGENILLAAKIWKINNIDFEGNKIDVVKAKDGKPPLFFGSGGEIQSSIRIEMLKILKTKVDYSELDETVNSKLNELRFDFKNFIIDDFDLDRPLIDKNDKTVWFTFSGTKVNRSIKYILQVLGVDVISNEDKSSLEIDLPIEEFKVLAKSIDFKHLNLENSLEQKLRENESYLNFSKWGEYLPMKYKVDILKERYFDFPKAFDFLRKVNFKESQLH